MKPLCKLFMSAAALFVAAACSNDLDEPGFSGSNGPTMKMKVLASTSDNDSRVVIGDKNKDNKYPVTWEDTGEILALAEFIDGNLNQTVNSTRYDLNEKKTQATFDFKIDIENTGSEYLYHALSPADALDEFDEDGVYFTLPSIQKPRDNGGSGEYKADPKAMILYSCDATANSFRETRPANLKLRFQHLAAYSCLTIKGLKNDGAVVKSVTVTAKDDYLTGDALFMSDENGDDYTKTENVENRSVTLDVSGLNITDDTFSLWFTTLHATISKDSGFTVTVTAGETVFTRVVTPEEMKDKDLTLQAGHVSRYTVNMENADSRGRFDGGYMIVAKGGNTDKLYAMSSTNSKNSTKLDSNDYDSTDVTGPVECQDVNQYWVITKIPGMQCYTITNNGAYLYAGSSNSTDLKMSDNESGNNTKFTIAENDDASGTVRIHCLASEDGRFIGRNSSTTYDYFGAYGKGNYYDIYLVPVVVENVPVITVKTDLPLPKVGIEGADSGSLDVEITNAENVTVNSEATWITDLSYTDGSITYKVAKNDGAAREGSIVITATGATGLTVTKEILVKQDGKDPYVGTFAIVAKVASSNSYYALTSESGGSYLKSKSFEPTEQYRGDDKTIIWNITNTEGGYYISNGGDYLSAPDKNGAKLSATKEVLEILPQPNEEYVYIKSTALTSDDFYLKYNTSNPRFAFYSSTNALIQNLFLIPAEYIELPKIEGDFSDIILDSDDTESHDCAITVNSATKVEAKGYDADRKTESDWLTVKYETGKVSYSATKNTSEDIRTAYIVITAENENGTTKQEIKVTQKGFEAPHTSHVYTLTFNDIYSGTTSLDGATLDFNKIPEAKDIKFTFSKGTNSTAPTYYGSGTALRFYSGNTMTVSSDNTITKIVLTYGTSDGTLTITATPGSFSSPTWTGNAKSVTFTIPGTESGNRRIASVTVYCNNEGEVPTPTPPTITPNNVSVSFDAAGATKDAGLTIDNATNVEFNCSGNWFKAVYSGGKVTVTAEENTETTERNGTITVTASNDSATTATATITVTQAAGSGGNQGGTTEPAYYQKVTSTAEVTDGEYLIVCESKGVLLRGDQSSNEISGANNTLSVTIDKTNQKIASDNNIDAYAFEIKKSGSAYTIKSIKQGFYIGHTGSSNTLNTNSSSTVTGFSNSIEISNGNATIKVVNTNYSLQHNNSNSPVFRYYTSNQLPIQLYKKVGGSTEGGGNSGGETTEPETPSGGTYICDFSKMSSQASGNTQAYSGVSFEMTTDKGKWLITNGNNQNKTWSYVRFGKKDAPNTGTIETTFAVKEAITKVSTEASKNVAAAKTTTVKLVVATDNKFTNTVGTYSAQNITADTNTYTFNITTPKENCYYRLEYYNDTSSNGSTQVSSVTLTY